MQQPLIVNTRHDGRNQAAQEYLRQEIAFLEARLYEMGEKGDCAYEHRLSRAYQSLLSERRQQLSIL